ncbi:MAG TPA: hypothetical protein DD635_03615 [Flavobacteriales bacterium]|nr:hypothetical protein [Flavobacteriales bacterium]
MLIWMAMGVCFVAHAEAPSLSAPEQYIADWNDEAVYQMAVYGIPASITLAQGILESGSGRSELAAKSNNHFGIKCHSDWDGERVYHDDDRRNECFRSYGNASESFHDHSKFLKRNRYEVLFELEPTDYVSWAKGLKKCGYATNPKYANQLIEIIERYELNQYDDEGLALKAEREAFAAKTGNASPNEALETVQNKALNPAKSSRSLGHRSVQTSENYIQYILAESGDSYEALSVELDLMRWQLYSYNDIDRKGGNYAPKIGEIIYLQPKRRRGRTLWMEIRSDESIWEASQRCGVSVKALVRKNRLTPESPRPANNKLSLKWRITEDGRLPKWVRTIRGLSS